MWVLLYSADLLEWKRYGGPPQRTLDVLLERNNTQQRIYCVISITVLPIIKPLNLKDKWRPFSRELVYVVRSKWKNASTRRVALSFLLGRATELRAAVLVTPTLRSAVACLELQLKMLFLMRFCATPHIILKANLAWYTHSRFEWCPKYDSFEPKRYSCIETQRKLHEFCMNSRRVLPGIYWFLIVL